MPMNERKIPITADTRKLVEQLANVNNLLKQVEGSGIKANDSISKGADKGGRSLQTLKKIGGGVINVFKSMGAAFGGATAGLVVGINQINQSMTTMESGLMRSLQIQASGFGSLAKELSLTTNSLIDVQAASEFLRKGKGMGMSIHQIKTITKMGAELGLVSREFDSLTATTKLFEALSGSSAASTDDLSVSLANAIETSVELSGATTHVGKQQAVLNAMMANYKNVMEETGNAGSTSMGKLLGVFARVREESKGLVEIMQGVAGVAGGILAPLGLGAAGGALVGGPVGGAIGIAIGGLVSAGLAAAVWKIGSTLAGDKEKDGDISEKIGAYKIIVEQFMAAGGMFALTGSAMAEIPTDIMEKAGLDKKSLKSLFDKFITGGSLIRTAGKSFEEGFKEGLPKDMFDGFNLKDFKSPIAKIAWGVGLLAGKIVKLIKTLADLIAPFVTLVDGRLPSLTKSIDGLQAMFSLTPLQEEEATKGRRWANVYTEAASVLFGSYGRNAQQSSINTIRIGDLQKTPVAALEKMRGMIMDAAATPGQRDDIALRTTLETVYKELKSLNETQRKSFNTLERTEKLYNEAMNKR